MTAAGLAAKQISLDALTSYLLFGSVSEPVTLIEGVFSLPPGHRMLLYVPERRRVPRARPWWDPTQSAAARDPKKPRDVATAAGALRPMLEDAVRVHLVADVPVGLFLSSGLDSGAIAALAARAQPGIRSFTLTFPGTAYDQGTLAKEVAKHCGTLHTEVPLDDATLLERIDQAVGALDQPTMNGIHTYFVSWAAQQLGLKVALSGLGGNELFAGYPTFVDVPRLARLTGASRFVPEPIRQFLAPILRSLMARRVSPDGAQKAAAAWRDPDVLPNPYFYARALFPPDQLRKLTEPKLRASSVSSDGVTLDPTWLGWLQRTADAVRTLEPTAAISWLELRSYTVSTLLRGSNTACRRHCWWKVCGVCSRQKFLGNQNAGLLCPGRIGCVDRCADDCNRVSRILRRRWQNS